MSPSSYLGSIWVVLHLAREFGKYSDCLIDVSASVGDLLPRFRSLKILFPSHKRPIQAFSIVPVDVLTFRPEAKAMPRRVRSLCAWIPAFWQFKLITISTAIWSSQRRSQVHIKTVEQKSIVSHNQGMGVTRPRLGTAWCNSSRE